MLAQGGDVARLVPRDVQGDSRRRTGEAVHHGRVVELLLERARLASAGKAPEARAPGAEAPRRHCDLEATHRVDGCIDAHTAAVQLLGERGVVALVVPKCVGRRCVDEVVEENVHGSGCAQRRPRANALQLHVDVAQRVASRQLRGERRLGPP